MVSTIPSANTPAYPLLGDCVRPGIPRRISISKTNEAGRMRHHPLLSTPISLDPAEARDVAAAMNGILADVFALYIKTMNFHWHMSGTHFRDYHLLLDEQADQILGMTDPIAERVRKLGEL